MYNSIAAISWRCNANLSEYCQLFVLPEYRQLFVFINSKEFKITFGTKYFQE
jgi:hypothetical protein